MAELATAWISLALSGRRLKRDVEQTLGQVDATPTGRRIGEQLSSAATRSANFSGVESKASEAGRRAGAAIGGALGTGIRLGAATAVAGLTAVLAKGFDRLKTIDSARFKLTALGNDAEQVKTIMDSALQSVQGTAYSMGDAATIAASAVAAGVKPGKELTAYLKLTADASAVAGTNLSDMGRIINQVRTGTKAYTEDLNQLADRGIPIYQWIAKEAGVAAGDVKKMASEGQISSEMFEKAITNNIGGAAQKLGQSFEGSMQNLSASAARVGATLLTSIFGGKAGQEMAGPTEAVQKLSEKFDQVNQWIIDHGPQIQEFFQQVGHDVQVVAGELGKVLGFLADHPRAIEAVVLAFAGWKAITAVAALVEGLTTATTLLKGIPGLLGAAQAAGASATATSTGAAAAASRLPALGALGAVGAAVGIPLAAGQFMAQVGGPTPEQAAETKRGNQSFEERLARTPFKTGADVPKVGTPGWIEMRELASTGRIPGITVRDGQISDAGGNPIPEFNPRSIGALVMADGGLRQIAKPTTAGLYAGRGAGTIFAEKETGGEAYIPLAPSKRSRSVAILSEVARLFGITSFAEGGLNAGASYIKGLIQQQWPQITNIGGYRPPDGYNEHSSGNALDIMIPNWNTPEGEALGNQIGGWIAANAQSFGLTHFIWRQRLYRAGDTTGTPMGDRGSPTQNHMDHVHAWFQKSGGALPTGPIVGAPGYASGGSGGASTSQVMSAQASVRSTKAATAAAQRDLDEANAELNAAPDDKKRAAAEKKRDNAQRRLDAAKDRQAVSEQRLSEVLDKKVKGTDEEAKTEKTNTGPDGQQIGQGIVSGILQSIGLDGSVFSNPFEWPNVKSLFAGLNFGGNLLRNVIGSQGGDSSGIPDLGGGPGGALPSIGLPNVTDFIKPLGPEAMTPNQPVAASVGDAAAAAQSGPMVAYNGPVSMGVDPRAMTQRQNADMNQAFRRSGLNAVRPS